MKMKRVILAGLIMCLLASVFVGCTKEATFTPAPEKKMVTIVDGTGKYVEIPIPVNRIISIAEGRSSELICMLGDGDKIVGRDSLSTFPSYLKDIPEVAKTSFNPNVELLLELKPDVVIAGTMLDISPGVREKIENAGVPVIVDAFADPSRLIPSISNLGMVLGKKEKAQEIIDYIEQYRNLVKMRLMKLNPEDKPSVFFEWRGQPYLSCSAEGIFHKTLVDAGARNIAAGEPTAYPNLSAEWVFSRNPDVIVKCSIAAGLELEEMKKEREELMARAGLDNLVATQDGKVYIISYAVTAASRYHVGLLAFAKWFHPDLFCDIDIESIHQETIEKFFGEEEWQKLDTVSYYPMSGPTCEEPDLPEGGMPGRMPGRMK